MKNSKQTVVFLFSCLLVLSFSLDVTAATARTIGLGDEFAIITGADALYGNPGAIRAGDMRFALEPLGVSTALWNNLLMNDYISEDDKDDILERIEDDGWLIGTEVRAGSKLMVGPVGLFADAKYDGLLDLNHDLAEVLLKGNQIGEEYDFSGTGGSGAVYGDAGVSLSMGMPQRAIDVLGVDDAHWGMTYHSLVGVIYEIESEGDFYIGYDPDDLSSQGQFVAKYNEPGEDLDNLAMGSALDFGVHFKLNEKYALGFSVLGLGSLEADSFTEQLFEYDEEEEEWEDSKKEIDEKLTWKLPNRIRVSGEMDFSDNIDLMAGYTRTDYYGGQTDHKLAIATELTKLRIIHLWTGVNYSTLKNNLAIPVGLRLNLGPWKTDVGISDLSGLYNASRGLTAGVSTRIEF